MNKLTFCLSLRERLLVPTMSSLFAPYPMPLPSTFPNSCFSTNRAAVPRKHIAQRIDSPRRLRRTPRTSKGVRFFSSPPPPPFDAATARRVAFAGHCTDGPKELGLGPVSSLARFWFTLQDHTKMGKRRNMAYDGRFSLLLPAS